MRCSARCRGPRNIGGERVSLSGKLLLLISFRPCAEFGSKRVSYIYIYKYMYLLFGHHVRSEGSQIALVSNVAAVDGLKLVRYRWCEILRLSERQACWLVGGNSGLALEGF